MDTMTEIKMSNYKYGMRLRGFAPGAQPLEGLLIAEPGEQYGERYYNILTYSRRLSQEEIREYELDEL